MKFLTNLIIFSIFSLLFPCMSNGESCVPLSCSYNGLSIKYPFRIKDRQPNSCGSPGFDVHCDSESGGTLLELPSVGNMSIEYIFYYIREVYLSDPENCLPQKLMSLDLDKVSPFQPQGVYKQFHLYNCSDDYNSKIYNDKIDCLSRFGYTVISTGVESSLSDSKCRFLKTVNAPSFSRLSSISKIYLTWNQTICASCDSPATLNRQPGIGLALGLGLGFGLPGVIVFILILYAFHKKQEPTNNSADNTTRNVNEVSRLQGHSTADVTSGLDQITIDSYPVVLIGESGTLISPDDDTCPICLSDYAPHEMLKILPGCLHRFHADCINQWLRAKAICPICRTSPQN